MSGQAYSWFREEAKLLLLYVTAGAAAIPAGIVYAFVRANHWQHWWTVLPVLVAGLICALVAWRQVERYFQRQAAIAQWKGLIPLLETFNTPAGMPGFKKDPIMVRSLFASYQTKLNGESCFADKSERWREDENAFAPEASSLR
jgi:hypothetical protein